MISLKGVEDRVKELFDEVEVIAVSISDERKGEKILALYSGDVAQEVINREISLSRIPPIMRPSKVIKVDTIPKLASGKSDFKRAKEIASELSKGF